MRRFPGVILLVAGTRPRPIPSDGRPAAHIGKASVRRRLSQVELVTQQSYMEPECAAVQEGFQDLDSVVVEELPQDGRETVAPRRRQPYALGEGGDREGARVDECRERLPDLFLWRLVGQEPELGVGPGRSPRRGSR
ncbi:hypothetical protein ACFYQA_27560 [Streptomyces sp. NPDC005774]|uniref:hypothetical protein n=1 Tax=Streptomyces sp. NPDC005774 TaxID=3364728 RepID=UPI0036879E6B